MQEEAVIKIGWYQLRDRNTGDFLSPKPLYKTVSPKVAEAFADRIATLLVDCYTEYEKSKGLEADENFVCNAKSGLRENCIKPKILVPYSQKIF